MAPAQKCPTPWRRGVAFLAFLIFSTLKGMEVCIALLSNTFTRLLAQVWIIRRSVSFRRPQYLKFASFFIDLLINCKDWHDQDYQIVRSYYRYQLCGAHLFSTHFLPLCAIWDAWSGSHQKRGKSEIFDPLPRQDKTIWVQKFGSIRMQILFRMPLLYEYEYKYSDYSDNTEYEYEYEYKNHYKATNIKTLNRENCILGLLCLYIKQNIWNFDMG